jgi:hypothetical protein
MKNLTGSNETDRNIFWLFLILLSIDLAFLGLHGLKEFIPRLDVSLFRLESDGGLAESFQYIKELAIIVFLLVIGRRRSGFAYLSWVTLFLYVLCDDLFMIHESAGLYISDVFELSNPLVRSRDVGELLVSLTAGTLLFGIIGFAYVFGSKAFRAFSHDLIVLFGLLAFFGIVVDLIHAMFTFNRLYSFLMAAVEEVGEMLVMSLIVIYAYGVSALDPSADFRVTNKVAERLWGLVRQRSAN